MRKLYVGIRFWSVVASFVLVVGLFSSEARTIRSASLREALSTGIVSQIVGDDGSSPPVVNESKSLRLHVEDANGSRLVVRSWRTDSPAVARVSKKGALKGLLYGFATISATVDSGEVVTETVVVSRVTPRGGMPATGDLKSDLAGNVYLTDPLRHVLFRSTGVRDELYAGVSGSAGHSNGAGRSARFHSPTGLAIDTRPDGGLFVADSANHCIRRVSFTGVVSDALGTPTLPGVMLDDEQQLSAAKFDGPQGLALLGRDFIVADTNNHALFYADLDADGTGVIYRIGGSPGSAGIVDGPGQDSRFQAPTGLAVNSAGTLVAVADTGNHRVRLLRLTRTASDRPSCCVTTVGVPGSCGSAKSQLPPTNIDFQSPRSVAFDGVDNLYVVDDSGASVVTRKPDGSERRVDLALRGTLGQPSSVVTSGTRVLVVDLAAVSANDSVKVVEVGPPTIDSLSTDVDTVEGGVEVVITGSNFSTEARVSLGDAVVTDAAVLNARTIRFRVPRQFSTGSRTLTVSTRGGAAQRPFTILPLPVSSLAAGEITTIAGGGVLNVGDGGTALGAVLSPEALARDTDGTLYIADALNHRVRRIDARTGIITTVAGTGVEGLAGDGGPAVVAQLSNPTDVALDSSGNLLIADSSNHRVRRVDRLTGTITTIAGSGEIFLSGDGGNALAAGLEGISAVVVDARGNMFLADPATNRIRRVDARTGTIDTIAGNGQRSDDDTGIGDHGDARLARIGVPVHLELGPDNALYVCEGRVPRIRRIDLTTNIIETFVYNPTVTSPELVSTNIDAMTFDRYGAAYYALAFRIWKYDAATGRSTRIAGSKRGGILDGGTSEAKGMYPYDLAIDSAENFIVADGWNYWLLEIPAGRRNATRIGGTGEASSLGDGGFASSIRLYDVGSIAADPNGVEYLAADNRVWRIDAESRASVILGTDKPGNTMAGLPGRETSISGPSGLATGLDGRLFVADIDNGRVLEILADGRTRLVAGRSGSTDLGDGGPAVAARLARPYGLAIGPDGALYIADAGDARVRRVDPADGTISTYAGTGLPAYSGEGLPATMVNLSPTGLAFDLAGDLLVTDPTNRRVWRIDSSTRIATVIAGGGEGTGENVPPRSISVTARSVAVDSTGGILLGAGTLRFVDPLTGLIRTVAGDDNGVPGGDGMDARTVRLGVTGIVATPEGNVLIGDSATRSVRVIRGPFP